MRKNNSKTNKHRVLATFTDWNRKNAEGKYGGVGWYRIVNPFGKIEGCLVESGGNLLIGGLAKDSDGIRDNLKHALQLKEKGDIWVFKYIDDINVINELLTAKDVVNHYAETTGKWRKTNLVIDVDDDMFHINPLNYAYKFHYPGSPKNEAVKYLISKADHVIVSTEPLAEVIREVNPKVTVIPNTIDPKIWEVPIKKNKGKKVRIGWISSANHEQDIPAFKEAMGEVLIKYPQAEFLVVGYDSEMLDFPHKVVLGTSGYEEYPAFLASLGLDISIAPLIDDKFNHSKSNIKWMESAMCEIPMVASNITPYSDSIEHYKTGYLAKNKAEWVKYLSWLIENPEKRKETAKNAKKAVLAKYHVDKHLHKYTELFDKL